MNIEEVRELIHEVLRSDIREFELEQTGTRIRLKREPSLETTVPAHRPVPIAGTATPAPPVRESVLPVAESVDNPEESGLHILTSPIEGTV
jgi:biotin carboxyl carrier protein